MTKSRFDDLIIQAEIAEANGRHDSALECYKKALADKPDDIYALSRAGALCAALRKFDDALSYFEKCAALEPDNGEYEFHLGGAYFLLNRYKEAFIHFAEAERKGCGEETAPQLYYQMAVLYSVRGGKNAEKRALIYLKKCEDVDKDGNVSLSPDFLSEKLKLHLAAEDYDGAERCASRLLAADPLDFKNYMVYFSVLMAGNKLDAAEKTLSDAESFSVDAEKEFVAIAEQKTLLYMAMAEAAPNLKSLYYQKAAEALKAAKGRVGIHEEQRDRLDAALAEVYLKMERNDEAIAVLTALRNRIDGVAEYPAEPEPPEMIGLTVDQALDMADADMDKIQRMIDTGRLNPNLRLFAAKSFDEFGNVIYQYPEDAFRGVDDDPEVGNEAFHESSDAEETPEARESVASDFRDRVYFLLLSAFLAKDDFIEAEKIAGALKHSENVYYSYYGLYSEALSLRKRLGDSDEVKRKYAEAVAYFRNRAFADPRDALASIFRARLYAEDGKYEKAAEIANLLAEADQNSVLNYIETCRTGQ